MADTSTGEKTVEVASAIENDAELQAMRAVLGALVPLKREARTRVLDYVLNRLGMAAEAGIAASGTASDAAETVAAAIGTQSPSRSTPAPIRDIRSLKEEKIPRSANEMTALVAYYLSELAPERKPAITAEDLRTHFIEARFPLPNSLQQALINAKNAGYLKPVGTGQYALNSVGYNLVVHKLPVPSSSGNRSTKRPRKKPGKTKRA